MPSTILRETDDLETEYICTKMPEEQWLFENKVMPHLGVAYDLAFRLSANAHDAEDIVQEACLRALRFGRTFRGGNGRAWFLMIVRNTAYSWFKKNRPTAFVFCSDDQFEKIEEKTAQYEEPYMIDATVLRAALDALPLQLREVLLLREMKCLSYKEISESTNLPIGTVMSRLARARKRLQTDWPNGASCGPS